MDVEIHNFIKVWISAIISMFYSYYVAKSIPSGYTRLLSLLPIIYLFTILPLTLSSFHLGAPTIFYLVWLGNFKLLLFSFDKGPLSSRPPLSLLHFISIALLPIKSKTIPDQKSTPSAPHGKEQRGKSPNLDNIIQGPCFKILRATLFATKVALLAIIVYIYRYRQYLHPATVIGLYCCNLYLAVELVLAITAVSVRAILGLELEPQFNEPYLATSLQDFWGRRWNLMVTSILRPTVYNPIRSISAGLLGPNHSLAPAILATFLVSGLMHEIIYYYFTRLSPTWEVTWFFVLHGVCVACEVAIKKALTGRWRLHRVVSGPLTIGFLAVTGAWLFFPQILRNEVQEKAIDEYFIFARFIRDKFIGNEYVLNNM